MRVEADRRVIRKYVEDWDQTTRERGASEVHGDGNSEAPPPGARVHGDSAQLDMRREAKTLASHGDQAAGRSVPYAQVSAELDCPRSEWAGSRGIDESEHLGNVAAAERHDVRLAGARRRQARTVQDHLQDWPSTDGLPTLRRRLFGWSEEPCLQSRREIGRKIGVGGRIRLGDRRKWRDVTRIMTRSAAANGKIRMRPDESVPDRIVERVCCHGGLARQTEIRNDPQCL
jgi:hypothetical protein